MSKSQYYSRQFSSESSIFVCFLRLFYTATFLWGHVFYPLSGDRRLSISRWLKMYYFYGKVNRGHVVCPLYGGGGQYLRESIMGVPLYYIAHSLAGPSQFFSSFSRQCYSLVPRPLPAFLTHSACNTEKLGVAWGRG